jgi:murein DD-endopeptidase MepM/ murein hydrolase activator NlpD
LIIFVKGLEEKKNIKSRFEKLKAKHKLSFTNETTYHEKWSVRLSSLNLLSLMFLYSVVVIVLFTLLIKYTPIKYLFVSNANIYELNEKLNENSEIIDSLEFKIVVNDAYLKDLHVILNGGDFNDSIYSENIDVDPNYQPDFSSSSNDSVFRSKIESEKLEALNIDVENVQIGFYMSPVSGKISKSLDLSEGHYGVDIVTRKDEPIKATLEGVVLMSTWTATEGNVIVLQHHNDLISIYKHCSVLLVQNGDKVEIGDPVGIVGNTGEYSTGPHLHFELWQNGIVLNPQEFISF